MGESTPPELCGITNTSTPTVNVLALEWTWHLSTWRGCTQCSILFNTKMLPKALFWHLGSAPSSIFQDAIWKCNIGMLVGALWLQHRLVGFTVLGTVGVVVSIQGLSERLTSGQSWFWPWWPGISRKLELQILNLQQAPGLQLINQGNLSERDCKLHDPMMRSHGSWAAEDMWQGQREASWVSVSLDSLFRCTCCHWEYLKDCKSEKVENYALANERQPLLVQATTS